MIRPLIAIAPKHHSATAENRRAASAACSPPRSACASKASRPPAQIAPAIRWNNRLLVAMSCAPPEDECPVSTSGSNVTSDPANSTGVQDQRSTGMLSTVTSTASSAVHRHAPAISIRSATAQMSAKLSRDDNG